MTPQHPDPVDHSSAVPFVRKGEPAVAETAFDLRARETEEKMTDDERFSLVISDQLLPGRSGLELARLDRRHPPGSSSAGFLKPTAERVVNLLAPRTGR